MSTYLRALAEEATIIRGGQLNPDSIEVLRFPKPRFREMRNLVGNGVIAAASDTSDGLLAAIYNIANRSRCGFDLELTADLIPDYVARAARHADVGSEWNLFFAWGDWSIAAAVPAARLKEFRQICEADHVEYRVLGQMTDSRLFRARLNRDRMTKVQILRNENFRAVGYNSNLGEHLKYMLTTPIFSHDGD